jgi:hypothetical protein
VHKAGGNLRGAAVATAASLLLLTASTSAQWVKVPLPGTPRMLDGTPNLAAPAPRMPDGKPDLSGIWRRAASSKVTAGNLAAAGAEVLFQPWAQAVFDARREQNGKGAPSERCLPHGIAKGTLIAEPTKIVQTPGLIVILYEEFTHYRQVYTDGRQRPSNRKPTWLGYSLGRWEDDTLVVDTRGFVNDTWLDFGGHPATDALHFIERYRRRDFGHMDVEFTVDDPKAYLKPWSFAVSYDLLPDTEIFESTCENERDAPHLVGK